MPMQGPQALSKIRAPAAIISASAPFWASMVSTCLDPGEMVKLTLSATVLPFKILATFMISIKEELVQEPTHT